MKKIQIGGKVHVISFESLLHLASIHSLIIHMNDFVSLRAPKHTKIDRTSNHLATHMKYITQTHF